LPNYYIPLPRLEIMHLDNLNIVEKLKKRTSGLFAIFFRKICIVNCVVKRIISGTSYKSARRNIGNKYEASIPIAAPAFQFDAFLLNF
jgi:hypothetical protein